MSDPIDLGALSDREILILLAKGQEVYDSRLNDHGRRLRALEAFRSWAAGAGAVAVAIGAALKLNVKVSQ